MTGEAHTRFGEIFEAHFADVRSYCRRRVPTADADDAVAETFTIAWRRLDDVPAGDEARLWLFGTARRVLANRHRSVARAQRLHLRLVTNDAPGHSSAPEDFVVDDDVVDVRRALETLSDGDQEVLRLLAWEELSHAEAASVLGCSVNAVGIRAHRARERLSAALRPTVGDDSSREAKGSASTGHVRDRQARTTSEEDRR